MIRNQPKQAPHRATGQATGREDTEMAQKRIWYAKYIGYCFTDNGREVILEDVFYWEDEKGRNQRTGYQLYYPDIGERILTDLSEMRRIARQTVLPK